MIHPVRCIVLAAFVFVVFLVWVPEGVCQPVPATISVDTSARGAAVPSTLWGIFFEEINRAGDGGLYAEMLQNRAFRDAPADPVGWKIEQAPAARVTAAIDAAVPLNAGIPSSLRLSVEDGGGARVALVNEGFKGCRLSGKQDTPAAVAKWLPAFRTAAAKSTDGLALRSGVVYRLVVYVRADEEFSADGPSLTASLEKRDGTVLASQPLEGIAGEWKRLAVVLAPASDATDARLVLSVPPSGKGTLRIGFVSLFPSDTFKGRENGMRPDLAGMLASMHPGFLRFPGGSFIEGQTLATAYRWKETIGPVEERPGHWQIWGYRSSDGLGFHEYLQLCEDLGAEPVYDANCGMAEKEFAPVDSLQPWIDDAVDAVAYANDPVDTKWGALRARNGHPTPFGLKYVEIGNENGLSFPWGGGSKAEYRERYLPFYRALKAKDPGLHLIATANIAAPGVPVDILDEHYYDTPEWFLQNATRYDRYPRNGPRIFVGEYAVTKGIPVASGSTLKAAVCEAAFMIGMERNADLVSMSCYAPLFINPAWRGWSPNAIVFDAARAFGSPSWQVQKLFGENRTDSLLETKVQCAANDALASASSSSGSGNPEAVNPSRGAASGKPLPVLHAVAGVRNGEIVVKIVNASAAPIDAAIPLPPGAGRAIVLTSDSPDDMNSFEQPDKVAPREEPVPACGKDYRRLLPPWSLTVLVVRPSSG
ncbi:MAG TPA: alpha-L-arabinofuranosidase C-terminal domain-containing protein [Candidatus Methylacidiphilales bacterium]